MQPAELLGRNFSVCENDLFVIQIARLIPDDEHWQEIRENFDEDLCRDPSYGAEIPGTDLRVITIVGSRREISVFYAVDEDNMRIELVEAWETTT